MARTRSGVTTVLSLRCDIRWVREQILGTTRGALAWRELHDRCGYGWVCGPWTGIGCLNRGVKLPSKEHFLQLALPCVHAREMPISVDLAHRLSDFRHAHQRRQAQTEQLSKGCEQSEALKHRLARKMDARHTSDRTGAR
jgi:hypothetical protein